MGYPKASRSNEITQVAAVAVALTVPVVAIRFWSRLVTVRSLGWDDWSALISLVGRLSIHVSSAESARVIRILVNTPLSRHFLSDYAALPYQVSPTSRIRERKVDAERATY